MTDQEFHALLLAETAGWSVEFRHPSIPTDEGNGGMIQIGLPAKDAEDAAQLCADLNGILGEPELWSPSGRGDAAKKYDSRIVQIFYDKLEEYEQDLSSWA